MRDTGSSSGWLPRLILTFAAGALVGVTAPHAQQTPPQPAATFSTTAEAVGINVYVTDQAGSPVAGLTVDDFELFESGVRLPITTFSAVDIPIDTASFAERELAEPDVQANNEPEGRLYVFALDAQGGGNLLRTRKFVRDFLEHHFGPHDIGAVALLGRGLATDGQDFTGNRRLLLEAVDKFSGGELSGFGSCSESGGLALPSRYQGRTGQFESLRSLAELLGRMPGRHKTMLLFTSCLHLDMFDVVDYRGGVLGLGWTDAHAMMTAATRSNLAIYPIHPGGRFPMARGLEQRIRFRALAEATNGKAFIDSNSYTRTFEQIVRDNSTYYMLGFNTAYTKDDGRYVPLDVRVTRPGLTVHTRDGYVAPLPEERRARDREAAEPPPASAASAALASPLATDGLPIRVFAAPFKGEDDTARVAMVLELDASTLGLTPLGGGYAGTVDISYVATDARRHIYPEQRHVASVRIEPDAEAPASLDGVRVRVLTELRLEQGRRYQLRVGASGPADAGGVVYDLVVPTFSDGDLALSGLTLVEPSERGVLTFEAERLSPLAAAEPVKCYSERCFAPLALTGPLRPAAGPPLEGALPGVPTTLREFAPDDDVVLAVEVYDNRKGRPNDPAQTIALAATLRALDGRIIPVGAETRATTAGRRVGGGHVFALPLALEGVPAGAYALRVEASSTPRRTAAREILVHVR